MGKVSIRKEKIKGGYSIFLDYTYQGKRCREYLQEYLWNSNTPQQNKETLEYCNIRRNQVQHEISMGRFKIIPSHKKKIDFILFMQDFIDNYKGKDINKYNAVKSKFTTFLKAPSVPAVAISEKMADDFRRYLRTDAGLYGETPFDYFKVFKRFLKAATKEGMFIDSPAKEIRNNNPNKDTLRKNPLNGEDLMLLMKAPCKPNIRRAFLIACQLAMGRAELVRILWRDINLHDKVLYFDRSKTGVMGEVPLNENVIELLGEPGEPNEKVFNLPQTDTLTKAIKSWAKKAGINKHVTFYCARHSAATNLLEAGVDLRTIQEYMLLKSMRHLTKYTHVNDKMKRNAVNKLPRLTG